MSGKSFCSRGPKAGAMPPSDRLGDMVLIVEGTVDAVDTVGLAVVAVEAQLVEDIGEDEQAAAEAPDRPNRLMKEMNLYFARLRKAIFR